MPRKYKPEDLAAKYTTPAQKATRVKRLYNMIEDLLEKKRILEIKIATHYKEIGIHNGKKEEVEGVVWNKVNRRYE